MSDTTGLVIATHGRHYQVEMADGSVRHCFPRGKRAAAAAVGDQVRISLQGQTEGAIEAVLPRRNLLYRSDAQRSKQFAANLDQLLLVVATVPSFSDDLLGRTLVAAHSADIAPLIVLNKIDQLAALPEARRRLAPLADLGVPVIEVSAHDAEQARERLIPHLAGRASILLGQSGMGKSTLLNALVPEANAATREHSEALDAGRHTTTSTRLYHLPAESSGGTVIDSPGFQGFGLQHLSDSEVTHGFPEFTDPTRDCRFYNCSHRHEPGCGVLAALQEGRISPERHALYQRILDENKAGERY
ncbi:MAG: ribosome small subunit-dependent GTPase A [Pigmentiphaga sp.]|nr:ribosome small subunit-dependent GTPase A [Pigmentiphaga sp.]